MRDYSKDYNSDRSEDYYKTCGWTCQQILSRINSRVPKGTVYSRGEIDTILSTLSSQVMTALSNNRVVIDKIANRPAANPGNAGYIFVTNDENTTFSDREYYQQVFVSDGASWLEIVNRQDYTALNPLKGDMEKAKYDSDSSGHIDLKSGGTGRDLTEDGDGSLVFQNGVVEAIANYHPATFTIQGSSDVQLSVEDDSVQIFEPSKDIEVVLPPLPNSYTYFRIVNESDEYTLTVKEITGANPIIVLDGVDTKVADFHYNVEYNEWSATYPGGAINLTVEQVVETDARKQLTKNTTFYLDAVNGNDDNSGETDSAPFKSLNKVFELIKTTIDAAGFKITIELAPGDYRNPENTSSDLGGTIGGHYHIPPVVGYSHYHDIPLVIKGTGEDPTDITIYGLELSHEFSVEISNLTLKASADGLNDAALKVLRQGTAVLVNVALDSISPDKRSIGLEAAEGGIIVLQQQLSVTGSFSTLLLTRNTGFISTEIPVFSPDSGSKG